MLGRSNFTYFVAFLALLCHRVAAVTLYRMDFRGPQEIKNAGGFVAWDPNGTGTVEQHIDAELGQHDPWVSTTSSYSFAKSGATSPSEVYVYYIDSTGLNSVDTVALYQEKKEKHPHRGEKEWSVHGHIPWTNIIQWDTFKRNKKIATTTRADFDHPPHTGRSIRPFIA